MSGDAVATPGNRRQTLQFRRAARPPALSAEQRGRQAVVTDRAWRFFGSGAAMKAFLNGEHPALGGRPLDLAVNSDAGLDAVLAALVLPAAR